MIPIQKTSVTANIVFDRTISKNKNAQSLLDFAITFEP